MFIYSSNYFSFKKCINLEQKYFFTNLLRCLKFWNRNQCHVQCVLFMFNVYTCVCIINVDNKTGISELH